MIFQVYVNFHRMNDLAVFLSFNYDYFKTTSRFTTLRQSVFTWCQGLCCASYLDEVGLFFFSEVGLLMGLEEWIEFA